VHTTSPHQTKELDIMPAFLLADVSTDDMEAYRGSGYLDAVPVIAAKYNGRYRARGSAMKVLKGDWNPKRMVIIEFPTMEGLQAFYRSEEYAPYAAIRQRLTDSRIVALPGVEGL
jgi:uncharacterized protein (DUF1330 family)